MPIAAFCVESGRWNKREGERAEVFSSVSEVVATKDLKAGGQEQNHKAQSGTTSL